MPQPSISDTAATRVLEELLRTDPSKSTTNQSIPIEANVETLQRATGLARGTVHNALRHLAPVLERRSHWQDTARGKRGGKPTILHRLSRGAGEALVLDFDHDRVTAWRIDPFGNLLGVRDERLKVDGDAESAIARGARLLRKVPLEDWERVVGIGLSIPAPVDPDTNRTLGNVLPSWEDIDLDEILRGHLQEQIAGREMPILAENDANLAGLAEYRSMESSSEPGESISNLVLVKLVPGSIGVGAGAIINGQQLCGRGFAMELGHLTIDAPIAKGANEVECPHCKRTDCLQARISTDALIGGHPAPAWDDVVQWTRENLLSVHSIRANAEEVGDLAEVKKLDSRLQALATTDPYTRAIITAGEEMGRALAKVTTLLDPDVIALEGALAQAWLDPGAGSVRKIVGEPLTTTFLACSPLSRAEPVIPTLASSDNNCARGAGAAVLDRHLIEFILDRLKFDVASSEAESLTEDLKGKDASGSTDGEQAPADPR